MTLQSRRTASRRVPSALGAAVLVLAGGSGFAVVPAAGGLNILYVGASASQCGATSLAQALAMAGLTPRTTRSG